jgi:hypothetical protein
MAKAWLVHAGENLDLVASTQEIAINWLLEHGCARLDDEPLVETYNMETHEWEKWSMMKVAEYLGCSPREALVKLLNDDIEEDNFNWAVWLEQVEWIG